MTGTTPPAGACAPTERFSDRADAYAAARPGYPPQMAAALIERCALAPGAMVADLGSGTGLSCLPFLRAGLAVTGVEPNAAMRAAGERTLAAFAAFRSVAGRAEATGLADASVDLVIAAQAAHWFDAPAAGREAIRICRRPARAALIWNDRQDRGDAFAEGYEALLDEHGIDYAAIRHRHGQAELVAAFFGGGAYEELRFDNPTWLDWDTLLKRSESSSYVPAPGTPGYAPMRAALRRLFDATQTDGRVPMRYVTRVFCGAPRH